MKTYTFECGGCETTTMNITTDIDLEAKEERPTCPCGSNVPMFLVKG